MLDRFDSILEASCAKSTTDSWQLACDLPENFKVIYLKIINLIINHL